MAVNFSRILEIGVISLSKAPERAPERAPEQTSTSSTNAPIWG